MYKVMLVDDEALIREAVSENVDWEKHGYHLLGACKDGREAMKKIPGDVPDLLITDIYMPYVDGIELSKFVYENYPETKVVILSGYDEFEYAKQALSYHVLEYVLKPITAAEFGDILDKVRKIIDAEKAAAANIRQIKKAYTSNLPYLRGGFLNRLVSQEYRASDIKDKLKEYNIKMPGRYYICARIKVDNFTAFLQDNPEFNSGLARFAICNIAEEIMDRYQSGVAFQGIDENTIMIFSHNDHKELERYAEIICEKVQSAVKEFLNLTITIGIGKKVSSVQRLYLSLDGADKALVYCFLSGQGKILQQRDFEHADVSEAAVDIQRLSKNLVLGIKTNNKDGINAAADELVQEIKSGLFPRNRSIIYIQNLIISVMNSMDNSFIDDEAILDAEKELLNKIGQLEHIEQLAAELKSFCGLITDVISRQRDSLCKKHAVMAMEYINDNYMDSNVSLNSVCTHLCISVSYFSTTFKSYTGETFIEALTRVRMEKAKQLLENTSFKAYEVAAQVGYNDPHYFSISFKKAVGMTPSEYIKSRSSQEA